MKLENINGTLLRLKNSLGETPAMKKKLLGDPSVISFSGRSQAIPTKNLLQNKRIHLFPQMSSISLLHRFEIHDGIQTQSSETSAQS